MHRQGHLDDVSWLLRTGLGATAFLAGLDKFTNLSASQDDAVLKNVA
ncbi:MAG TPA: hypothetical protein VFR84_02965 [Candidatus Angelobacter sp.]|nr:hypothetical protein [Candidatus Angelobacter sp.]